jgi:hypothetical protein
LPADLPAGSYAPHFLAEFGATPTEPATYFDVVGEPLTISIDLFQDGRGNWKDAKNGRGPYLLLLAEALKEPDEIWMAWEASRSQPGSWLLKRRYIKVFELEEDGHKRYGLAVFTEGVNGWDGSTIFAPEPDDPAAAMTYLQKQRGTYLRYRRQK